MRAPGPGGTNLSYEHPGKTRVRFSDGKLVLSATDLAHFLSCRHLSALEMGLALGKREWPATHDDPMIDLLTQRGRDHEARYVEHLRIQGKSVFDAQGFGGSGSNAEKVERTRHAMHRGVDVIVQAALGDPHWFGIADILQRVPTPSALGDWSYEATDTKLALETRAGTVLQLGLYSELVAAIQGKPPERFHVVTPAVAQSSPVSSVAPAARGSTAGVAAGTDANFVRETHRVNDYAAYFRLMRRRLLEAIARGDDVLGATYYPDPVEHCGVCRWWPVCDRKRRDDDHPSLVANITRLQRRELAAHGVDTLTAIAQMSEQLSFKPRRATRQSYERVRQQARVQYETGDRTPPVYRLRDHVPERGLARLPEPSPGDLFLDLEGDPLARETRDGHGGREYLFGVVTVGAHGEPVYREFWGLDDRDERAAFEQVMNLIIAQWRAHEGMHVYHYAPYEPSAFRHLAGRYSTRGDDLDRLLRGGKFIDLLAVVRESMFVGVESYSIKNLEALFGFARIEDLRQAGRAREAIAYRLGAGRRADITPDLQATVARYNCDDCVATLRLRDWLETVRTSVIADGVEIRRPEPKPPEPAKELDDKAKAVEALRLRLLAGIPEAREERSVEQQARWILAHLIDWHRREDRFKWREYFELCGMSEEDLLDERRAVSGLEFVARLGPRIGKKGTPTESMIDRYRYPEQEMDIKAGDHLQMQSEESFGDVIAVNREERTIDIAKGPSRLDLHPTSLFEYRHYSPGVMEKALFAIAERVAEDGELHVRPGARDRATRDLLLRNPPRVRHGVFDGSDARVETNQLRALDLDETTLAVQGPPGSGKTYQGARMIRALVRAGKRVGVTATSHKVIRNLLDGVAEAAVEARMQIRLAHFGAEGPSVEGDVVQHVSKHAEGRKLLQEGVVLGGTTWLWARPDFAGAIDVLVVDEAGQMSLANVVATSQSVSSAVDGGSVILLGDPQQLEQPSQGAHPDGVGVSALDHILGEHQTIASDRGVFLETTWRLSPALCEFTSEVFYESKLRSRAGLEKQRLTGAGAYEGSGLFVVEVPHDGNRNASEEEVDAISELVAQLTAPGVQWVNHEGKEAQMRGQDVLIVSPYNAQVNRLTERLHRTGVRVGTVDKFQGQEAPVVIYSMATSRPEDAPRGMEFLYSPNRLNVATSRARCAAILVASPALFEPECRSPRQMMLANGVCRFVEMTMNS